MSVCTWKCIAVNVSHWCMCLHFLKGCVFPGFSSVPLISRESGKHTPYCKHSIVTYSQCLLWYTQSSPQVGPLYTFLFSLTLLSSFHYCSIAAFFLSNVAFYWYCFSCFCFRVCIYNCRKSWNHGLTIRCSFCGHKSAEPRWLTFWEMTFVFLEYGGNFFLVIKATSLDNIGMVPLAQGVCFPWQFQNVLFHKGAPFFGVCVCVCLCFYV